MKALAVIVFLVSAYLIVGTVDYRVAQAEAKAKAPGQAEPARIWSKRCARQGKQVFATQADGGRWKISCADATVKVKA